MVPVEFTTAGVLLVPLLGLTLPRVRWSLYATILSIPASKLVLFRGLSHEFVLPEVALLFLAVNLLLSVTVRQSVRIPKWRGVAYLVGFGIVCILSVVALYVRGGGGLLVHPYNLSTGFGAFELVPLAFSSNNLTQLVLRWFVIGAVIVLGLTLDRRTTRLTVRWILLSAIVVGVIGIVYQISIVSDVSRIPEFFRWVGFKRFPTDPVFTGPIPRMYSTTGEPGATADFLLYALALASSVYFLRGGTDVIERRTAGIAAVSLCVLLALTTGTTGYGGLVVLAVVTVGAAIRLDEISRERVATVVGDGGLTVFSALALASFAFPPVRSAVTYQIDKLSVAGSSGILRVNYFQHSVGLFLERPLLGLGVGSHHPTSILGTILAETGLLGVLVLLVALHEVLAGSVRNARPGSEEHRLAVVLVVAGTTLLLTNTVARSASATLFPWFWFSLAMPIELVTRDCREAWEVGPLLPSDHRWRNAPDRLRSTLGRGDRESRRGPP